mgnify:CR=1 FL=1
MLLFVLKNNGSLPLAIFPTLGYNKSTIADKETKTMKDGFLKIACVTPPLRVADCTYNADQIIVVDHGRIAEQGTHEELMAKKGSYYRMYQTQSMYYKEIGVAVNE